MRELSAIGNRINQLAAKANALNFVDAPYAERGSEAVARVSNRCRKNICFTEITVMAVCEIWDVRGRLDHPIDYAENPERTANPKYTEADLQAMVDANGICHQQG